MNNITKMIALIIIVVAVVLIGQRLFVGDDFELPQDKETQKETLIIKDREVVGLKNDVGDIIKEMMDDEGEQDGDMLKDILDKKEDTGKEIVPKPEFEEKEIFVTDGVRHSVPLGEILGGGPPKDGIPSIDDPKFISVSEAGEWLSDEEPGIALELSGVNRFYSFQILVWHEIVNDTIANQRVLVTYCPLCLSGIVFDPVVSDERVEFGTSGKLWNSNLVMYDRKTDSLWSQILGEAIVGEMTGTKLRVLPSDQIRFGEWKKQHPGGEVLSKDTGATRFYGADPYGNYYTDSGIFFPVNASDNRLDNKDFILGVVIGNKAKAYLPESVKRDGEIEDNFAGKTLIVRYESDIDAVRIFEKKTDGTLERINPFPNFWFSWVAVHPDTELYQ